MDSFTKQGLTLTAAVAVVLLLLLLVQGEGDKPSVEESILLPGETLDEDAHPQAKIPPEKIDPERWFQAPLSMRIPEVLDLSLNDAPEELHAMAYKLPSDQGFINVPLYFRSTRRCMWGDMDLLFSEFKKDSSAPIIVSLEPLNGNRQGFGQKYFKKISPSELDGGRNITLRIPESDRPRHLGLFICRDASGTQSCLGKDMTDLGDLLDKHLFGDPPKGEYIFFFQYLLLDNNTLTAINPGGLENPGGTDSGYQSMNSYLSRRTNDSLASGSAGETARRINSVVKSLPVVLDPPFVRVDLPRNDRGICAQEQPPMSLDEAARRGIK